MAKKTKNNSLVPVFIAVLILIVLLGASYFGYKNLYPRPPTTQATIDTTNWKTYTNNTYGFSFQYPPDEQINELSPKNINVEGRDFSNPLYAPLALTVFDNTNNVSIREWFRIHAPNDKVTERLFQDFLIDGNSAVMYLSRGAKVFGYFIKGNRMIIAVESTNDQLDAETQNKENAKILSTFKFAE